MPLFHKSGLLACKKHPNPHKYTKQAPALPAGTDRTLSLEMEGCIALGWNKQVCRTLYHVGDCRLSDCDYMLLQHPPTQSLLNEA